MNKKRNRTTGGPQNYKHRPGLTYRAWYQHQQQVWNFRRQMKMYSQIGNLTKH